MTAKNTSTRTHLAIALTLHTICLIWGIYELVYGGEYKFGVLFVTLLIVPLVTIVESILFMLTTNQRLKGLGVALGAGALNIGLLIGLSVCV